MGKPKSDLYEKLMKRIREAHDNGFYFEACWLAHALFEDRTRSIVQNSGDQTGFGKDLNGKIQTIRERLNATKTRVVSGKATKDKVTGNKEKVPKWPRLHTLELALIDKLDDWREDRNKLAHDLASGKSSFDKICELSEDLSNRALVIASEICAAAMRVKKHQAP